MLILFCASVPATETCHVKKAVRRRRKCQWENKKVWMNNRLTIYCCCFRVELLNCIGCSELVSSPGWVWQQCLRIAPKTLCCLPSTFWRNAGLFLQRKGREREMVDWEGLAESWSYPHGAMRPGTAWEGGIPTRARKLSVRSPCVKTVETW